MGPLSTVSVTANKGQSGAPISQKTVDMIVKQGGGSGRPDTPESRAAIIDQLALQIANARIEAGQRHQFLLDRFPVGQRIQQQTLVGVGSDDEAPGTAGEQRFAVTRGHREPAFTVQTELRYASKHDSPE